MSRFRAADEYVSHKGFANIPTIGDLAPLSQLEGSLDGGSTSSRVTGISTRHALQLEEGDLVTGTIDITHERAYMLAPIRDADRKDEKKAMEKYLISLKIIPPAYQEGWTLDHDSNTALLSRYFHQHLNTYATVLIVPSSGDCASILGNLEDDNFSRADIIQRGGADPGRRSNIDWFEGIKGEYELVILRHSHFLIGNYPLVIKHPTTEKFTCFYASEFNDGHLCEGSPDGLPLPPFRSRGTIDREIPLNPILVNWAAIIRFRRLVRQDPSWQTALSPCAAHFLQWAVRLHAAVIWNPQQSHKAELWFGPGTQPSHHITPGDYFRALDEVIQRREPKPNTALGRAFALLEAEFEELPDLGGDDNSQLLQELGAMTHQEKLEKLLGVD